VVVRELESLADQLVELRRQVQPFKITPPGSDAVSVNIAEQAGQMFLRSRDFLAPGTKIFEPRSRR